ncbi:MAG: hypothetical protein KDJ19_07975 [Hyphomicrobiaceae bacterium]|nr:hypothetical protein [Hyphomicrobiaceae bacterium]MCC0024009.1 hypothetical protein [Hyphomicrobiaceae bacterium]
MAGRTTPRMKLWLAGSVLLGGLAVQPAEAAKLLPGQDPATFYPRSMYLDQARMNAILTDGALWCMDPQAETCGFISIVTGSSGNEFHYDVIEKWDEHSILSTPVTGVLRDDGALCEMTTGTFDDISVTSTKGKPTSSARLEDIRAELRDIWKDDVGVEYCYTYVIEDPRDPNIITQFVYADGEYIDNPVSFIVDKSPDAMSRYDLRDL